MPPARSSPAGPTNASSKRTRPSGTAPLSKTVLHGIALGVACLASYELTTRLLQGVHSVAASDDRVGGMWAVIATVFVYRDTTANSMSAAISRVAATSVSLALCLLYLLVLPSHPWGLAALIALGSIAVTLLGRPEDAITAGVTTAVVMVIAELEPRHAWEQPILRLVDTVIGVVVSVGTAWLVLWAIRDLSGAEPGRPRHAR